MANKAHYSAVVVLTHLMDKDGFLTKESRDRAVKGAQLHISGRANKIVLTGWAYRSDINLTIAHAMENFIVSRYAIKKSDVLVSTMSRDTVGDAFFTRLKFSKILDGNEVAVVTSDYHAHRAKLIFDYIYSESSRITVFGIKTKSSTEQERNEESSLRAFLETFKDTKKGQIEDIQHALISRHPFYNGLVHPELKLSELIRN